MHKYYRILDPGRVLPFGRVMAVACVLTYTLSVLSMVLSPGWNRSAGDTLPAATSIFGFSVLLVTGIFLFRLGDAKASD